MKKAARIASRLGLDGNPLRRRIDKVSVLGTAGLLAVFLAGTPLSPASAELRVVLSIIGTVLVLAMALVLASAAFQRRLDRRRLAGWETSWTTVGPQWTTVPHPRPVAAPAGCGQAAALHRAS
jgi:drug/metabolite transporter (DMT)-like permease